MSKSSRAKAASREVDPKASKLAAALEQVPDGRQDEWLDLVVAALDETQGDVDRSIKVANACLAEGGPEDKLP